MEDKNSEVEQSGVQLDDKDSSISIELAKSVDDEKLRKLILSNCLWDVTNTTIYYLDMQMTADSYEVLVPACREVAKLSEEYRRTLGEVSVDAFEQYLMNFKQEINKITHNAGLGQLWKIKARRSKGKRS